MVGWLFGSFVVLLLIGTPIAASLGLAAVITIVMSGMRVNMVVVGQTMFAGMTSYQLMAIPLFILCGNLMCDGGLSKKLVDFINLFCRKSKGALAYVLAEVSVGTLFLTGFGPGILMAIFMLIYAYVYVKKNPNIKMNGQKVTAKEAATVFLQSIWALVMPVIILGGIYSGIFTPTESGAIASVYGLICGRYIYKTLEWKNLPKILVNTAVGAGTIMLILGSVQTFSVVLTRGHIPQILSEALLSVTTNKYILLLMFNILLLIAGMFLNAVSAIALFTPILLPIMTSVGVNPYLMGIVMIVNLGIGMITPPVGNCLYVACGMSKRLSFEQISKACIPYIVMLMIALLLITYVEPISMGLIWLTGASAI